MPFRFRQFTVDDGHSTMRVGTDAMLLGSWCRPAGASTILDIGTGCGMLALMMAQVSDARVDAIDIDPPSILEAAANFAASPWSHRLTAIHASLQEFSPSLPGTYDFILSNPPYFANALKSPDARKNRARHEIDLTLPELAEHTARLLSEEGSFCVVVPSSVSGPLEASCRQHGLFPSHRLDVSTRAGRTPTRCLTAFTRWETSAPLLELLTINDQEGRYTVEYLELTAGFHNL